MLGEFAAIYEFGMARGVSPRDLDQYELWEVGVLFGRHHVDAETVPAISGDALLAARVRAAKGEGEVPEPASTVLPQAFGSVAVVSEG